MKNKGTIRYMIAAVIMITWIVMSSFSAHASQLFELHLLDVGQGLSALVNVEGHYMLIDGGGRNSSSYVISYLKQQGIDDFDLVTISHYDEDHISGMIGVLSVFPVDKLLLPSYSGEGQLYQSLSTTAVSNGATIIHPSVGIEYSLAGATVKVVGPVRTDYELENDRSLALHITYVSPHS